MGGYPSMRGGVRATGYDPGIVDFRELLIVLTLASSAAAEPLRYRFEPGDACDFAGEFRSESVLRRGASVEKLIWVRAGAQRVIACAREGGRVFFAVEIDQGPAVLKSYVVDGKDRAEAAGLPGREGDVTFLSLDDRGAGTPVPRDADLPDAILRALDEIEVLPEGEEPKWERSGRIGPLAWTGAFGRSGEEVSAVFSFSVIDERGARIGFGPCTARIRLREGKPQWIEGSAAWTVAGADGSEAREISYRLEGKGVRRLEPGEAADAAADAAQPTAAEEAWRDGERDRALELWDKVARDEENRWAPRARARAEGVRRDWPSLGRSPGAWKVPAWIGAAPEAGGWQIVYFWASWAPRCEGELAGLARLVDGRKRVGVAAITRVDALQTEDAVRGVAGRLRLPFGVGLDDGGAFKSFLVEDLPRVFLVDPDGKVRFEGRGSELETLKALLDRLVPE